MWSISSIVSNEDEGNIPATAAAAAALGGDLGGVAVFKEDRISGTFSD